MVKIITAVRAVEEKDSVDGPTTSSQPVSTTLAAEKERRRKRGGKRTRNLELHRLAIEIINI